MEITLDEIEERFVKPVREEMQAVIDAAVEDSARLTAERDTAEMRLVSLISFVPVNTQIGEIRDAALSYQAIYSRTEAENIELRRLCRQANLALAKREATNAPTP